VPASFSFYFLPLLGGNLSISHRPADNSEEFFFFRSNQCFPPSVPTFPGWEEGDLVVNGFPFPIRIFFLFPLLPRPRDPDFLLLRSHSPADLNYVAPPLP